MSGTRLWSGGEKPTGFSRVLCRELSGEGKQNSAGRLSLEAVSLSYFPAEGSAHANFRVTPHLPRGGRFRKSGRLEAALRHSPRLWRPSFLRIQGPGAQGDDKLTAPGRAWRQVGRVGRGVFPGLSCRPSPDSSRRGMSWAAEVGSAGDRGGLAGLRRVAALSSLASPDSSRRTTLEKPAGFSPPDQSLVPLKSRAGLRPSRVSFASLRQLTTR